MQLKPDTQIPMRHAIPLLAENTYKKMFQNTQRVPFVFQQRFIKSDSLEKNYCWISIEKT